MKVFVTGGTGFLGSHIVMQLLNAGHQVTILARDTERVTGYKNMPGLTLVKGLIDDWDVIENAIQGHDACIHTVLNWGDSAVEMLQNDTLTSVRLFETAAQAGVEQCIFTSSTMALGEYRHDMHEEMVCKPLDFYGAGKAATENFLFGMSHKYPMRCNVVRPGRIIGRMAVEGGKDWSFPVVREMLEKALKGETINVIKNDGTQFIHGGDLAKIYMAILNAKVNRSVYFGLGKHFIDAERIARKAVELTGSTSEIVVSPNPYEDSPKLFDVSKIERDFGLVFDTWPELVGEMRDFLGGGC